eukprot:230815-Chlamydomonas_euryale.AAC.1
MQDFVFATVRPIRSRPVMVGVYVTLNKKKTGRLVGQFTEDIVDLVRVCEKADANAREHGIPPDTPALRKPTCGPEYQLPLMSWPLDQGYHGVLQMHVGAADWDYRAQMYNIPLLEEVRDGAGVLLWRGCAWGCCRGEGMHGCCCRGGGVPGGAAVVRACTGAAAVAG